MRSAASSIATAGWRATAEVEARRRHGLLAQQRSRDLRTNAWSTWYVVDGDSSERQVVSNLIRAHTEFLLYLTRATIGITCKVP